MTLDYLARAAGVWLVSFAPLTGLVSAVPAGVVVGLDDASVVVWSVLGGYAPALLVDALYGRLVRVPRLGRRLQALATPRRRERVDRWGVWFVLLATPWTTVWAMAVTVKVLGMSRRRFLVPAFVSVLVWAVVLLAVVRTGVLVLGQVS